MLMRKFYRLDITAHIGAQSQDEPALTCESLDTALDKLTEIGEAWRAKLGSPYMREIGWRAEIFLTQTDSPTGLFGGSPVRTVRIDRPLHSPSARVVVWDETCAIVSDSWRADGAE